MGNRKSCDTTSTYDDSITYPYDFLEMDWYRLLSPNSKLTFLSFVFYWGKKYSGDRSDCFNILSGLTGLSYKEVSTSLTELVSDDVLLISGDLEGLEVDPSILKECFKK